MRVKAGGVPPTSATYAGFVCVCFFGGPPPRGGGGGGQASWDGYSINHCDPPPHPPTWRWLQRIHFLHTYHSNGCSYLDTHFVNSWFDQTQSNNSDR